MKDLRRSFSFLSTRTARLRCEALVAEQGLSRETAHRLRADKAVGAAIAGGAWGKAAKLLNVSSRARNLRERVALGFQRQASQTGSLLQTRRLVREQLQRLEAAARLFERIGTRWDPVRLSILPSDTVKTSRRQMRCLRLWPDMSWSWVAKPEIARALHGVFDLCDLNACRMEMPALTSEEGLTAAIGRLRAEILRSTGFHPDDLTVELRQLARDEAPVSTLLGTTDWPEPLRSAKVSEFPVVVEERREQTNESNRELELVVEALGFLYGEPYRMANGRLDYYPLMVEGELE